MMVTRILNNSVQICTKYLTFYSDAIQNLLSAKCVEKVIDVSFDDIIKYFPKETDGTIHSIPVNHHKLTDTTSEYAALKKHVTKQLQKETGNLSCISFHGVPYNLVNVADIKNTLAFDIIDIKSHNTIEGIKGQLVCLSSNEIEQNFRIGLVEGLHRSNIFHEISDLISTKRRCEKMFKLTLYYGNPEVQLEKLDYTLFSKLSYNLSLELRSGNEHTLFDAMHNCVTHVISNGKYTCTNDDGSIKNNFFVFAHSDDEIKNFEDAEKNDKKKRKANMKRDADDQNRQLVQVKMNMEIEFMKHFISRLKHNRLVTQFIDKIPKHANTDLFNLHYLLSDNVPNLGPDTLMPLVTQSVKRKGTVISMRCITDGGCPLQLFFITSILLSTVMHSKFAEVSTMVIFRTGLYQLISTS